MTLASASKGSPFSLETDIFQWLARLCGANRVAQDVAEIMDLSEDQVSLAFALCCG